MVTESPLFAAIELGDAGVLSALLRHPSFTYIWQAGKQDCLPGREGALFSPIEWAKLKGHPEMVAQLEASHLAEGPSYSHPMPEEMAQWRMVCGSQ